MRSGHVRTKTGDNIIFSSRNAVVRKQGCSDCEKTALHHLGTKNEKEERTAEGDTKEKR